MIFFFLLDSSFGLVVTGTAGLGGLSDMGCDAASLICWLSDVGGRVSDLVSSGSNCCGEIDLSAWPGDG